MPFRFDSSFSCRRALRGVVAVFLGLTLLGGARLDAETGSSIPDYSFDVWQTEEGLPQNAVTAIVQTYDGYLWLGTYNGLARFDGVKFKVFNLKNTPELENSQITSLYEDEQGSLWIGNEDGDVIQYHAGVFTRVLEGSKWRDGRVNAINADAEGTLWALKSSGRLLCLKDQRSIVSNTSTNAGEDAYSFVKERSGKLWMVGGGLLGTLNHGRFVPWTPAGAPDDTYFERACPSREGGLWIVGNGRIKKLTAEGALLDLGRAPWGWSPVTQLLETKSGDLLAGTLAEGIFVLAPDGTHRQFTRQNRLSHDWVRCLFEDREGSIWVGTGRGLDAMRTRKVTMAAVPDDWQGRGIRAVTPCSDGGVWVATEGAGLYRYKDGTATRYAETNGLVNPFVWSVLEDHSHRIWVGTWDGGLFSLDGDRFQYAPGFENMSARILALYQARNGAVWVGTKTGLARCENGSCTWFTRNQDKEISDVRAITEDANGVIWFGMASGGLGRLQGDKITQFQQQDGLPNNFVFSLLAEDDGTLWIGMASGGLCRMKNGHFATISTGEGLPDDVICYIADDGHGSLWMSSNQGIFRAHKVELNRCADGDFKRVNCMTMSQADGLSTLECNGGSQPAGCKTADGRLWFSTGKGLAMIDPPKLKLNVLAPPVVIEDVVVDGQTTPVPQSPVTPAGVAPTVARLQISPGKQRFKFHFAGLSLVAPEKMRFKYQLEGLELDWVDAGSARVADYSYLRPGNYTFRVIACNDDGVWNETGASCALTVLPYFWQTWWFAMGAVLAGIGSVGGTARYVTRRRLRRRMERLEWQRAIERERARIAKDIHDDLGASLTRISLLSQADHAHSEAEDPQHAMVVFEKIYRTARESTRAMDEIVWAVNPQHDTLDSLVAYLGKFTQDLLSSAHVRCRLNLPLELPAWTLRPEVRHNLFLACKEALNNVLKHADATEVRVSLTLEEAGFVLLIEDNGKGFDPANRPPSSDSARVSSGNGLLNMRKRLEEIGSECELTSSSGQGTKVKFVVRVKSK